MNRAMSFKTRQESEDSKWNYFREDSLLHSFHDKWHTLSDNSPWRTRDRAAELFQYMHQQFLRRWVVGRISYMINLNLNKSLFCFVALGLLLKGKCWDFQTLCLWIQRNWKNLWVEDM